MQEEMCCPPFDPSGWDKQVRNWDGKIFIKDSIPTFFHIPLPWMIGKLMGRMWKQTQDAGAATETKDFLCLTYDPSPWKSEYYMAVTKEVPGAENVRLSGEFLTKVYDGPYSAVPKWIKDMEQYAGNLNKKVEKYYIYYTTCPKCAKKYGHNYVVTLAKTI